ncbi:MAG: serine--tRNA ligase [Armatimonadetes bacterium]|nr:serine--tRNA ligase [Armatimonadota bacterium]
MLDRQLIRENPEFVRQGALKKRITAPIDEWIATDQEWRTLNAELENKKAESNRISKSVGELMAQGKREEAEVAKSSTKALKEEISGLEPKVRELDATLEQMELSIPNLPHETVPEGKDEHDNVVVRSWGSPATLPFEPRPHWDVADEIGLLDLSRASKISGSGFVVYTGWGAKLQRALFNFMVDHQVAKNGYHEIFPPYIVNSASLRGTGQLPKFEEDLYKVEEDLYLIPTAEVPVTNLYRDEILDVADLPIRMAAYSACFRKEAGAAGKDTRGIQRVHQFDKVELVKLCTPESSYDELETLVTDAESVLQTLGLHYRVVLLCGPEMSFSNAKCYDIEIWSPAMQKYLEISSCSNFEAFQARRANIRFRREQGAKPEFAHVLNGSGLATPRLFAVLLETFYEPGIGIRIPEPLQSYVGTDLITK